MPEDKPTSIPNKDVTDLQPMENLLAEASNGNPSAVYEVTVLRRQCENVPIDQESLEIQLNKITDGYNFDSQLRLSLVNKKYSMPEIPIKTKYADEPNKIHVIYAIRFLLDLLISFTRKNFFCRVLPINSSF